MTIFKLAERIFEEHPSRFTKSEKEALRNLSVDELLAAGWDKSEIKTQKFKGMIETNNLIVGDPNAEYLITGHYDTPASNGWILFSSSLVGQTGANIIYTIIMIFVCILLGALPFAVGDRVAQFVGISDAILFLISWLLWMLVLCALFIPLLVVKNRNNRNDNTSGTLCVLDCAIRAASDSELKNKCCFILFDNEELGLIGSSKFAAWAKKNGINLNAAKVINLDCVGVGDILCAARTGARNEKQAELLERMKKVGLEPIEKRSSLVFMSDHANFPNSYMLSYCKRAKNGTLYLPNVHTQHDTECDVEKVDKLAGSLMNALKD